MHSSFRYWCGCLASDKQMAQCAPPRSPCWLHAAAPGWSSDAVTSPSWLLLLGTNQVNRRPAPAGRAAARRSPGAVRRGELSPGGSTGTLFGPRCWPLTSPYGRGLGLDGGLGLGLDGGQGDCTLGRLERREPCAIVWVETNNDVLPSDTTHNMMIK